MTALLLASCGDDDDASGPEPTGAERAWMDEICELIVGSIEKEDGLPGFATETSLLSLAERRTRAETLLPARAELHELFVEKMDEVDVPKRARKVHEETTALSRDFAAHLRSSAKEMDTIFASVASVDDWNRKTGEIFAEHTAAQNAALAEEPAMFALRPQYDSCQQGKRPG